jgi:hypothetical protein
MWKFIKPLFLVGALIFAGNYAWHFFTDAPSTSSICYTWSKATDPYLVYDETGVDGAQWLADNIKTKEDLANLDPDVLEAMNFYEENAKLFDAKTLDGLNIRQYVLDACEKAAPGSTKHS